MVAEHVAKFEWRNRNGVSMLLKPTDAHHPVLDNWTQGKREGDSLDFGSVPDYLLSPDLVLDLMDKLPDTLCDFYCASDKTPKWGVGIRKLPADRGVGGVHAKADTFCMAGCIALLRHAGVRVIEKP